MGCFSSHAASASLTRPLQQDLERARLLLESAAERCGDAGAALLLAALVLAAAEHEGDEDAAEER